MAKYTFIPAFKSRTDLKQYGPNALALFALQLFFGIEDITTIATDDIIVDGPDDGGLDLVHVDRENKFVVISQNYETSNPQKLVASPKKARDLSSGLTLLIKVPIEKVPKGLKSAAEELRKALSDGEIENFYIWYVHNLPGSKNVQKELQTTEQTAHALLKDFGIKTVKSLEVCAEELERKWVSISANILIKDVFEIPYSEGLTMTEKKWKSFVTSVSLNWAYQQFKKYGTDLFSANVRDYLGIIKRNNNINSEIQSTAQNDPSNFWVFNNGITALVNNFTASKGKLKFDGLSILNGAQTTGAIGNLTKKPDTKAFVQIRFVMCNDGATIKNIKKFNNSQNKIEAPDYRSNDDTQERLVKEFKDTGVAYAPRRGGADDIIKRRGNVLTSVLTGQILSTFHGKPDIAYHKKTEIWEDDKLYNQYFNSQTRAKNIILAYSLFEAVRTKKLSLNREGKTGKLSKLEEDYLDFLIQEVLFSY